MSDVLPLMKKTSGVKKTTEEETFYGFDPSTAYKLSGRSYEPEARSAPTTQEDPATRRTNPATRKNELPNPEYQHDEPQRALKDRAKYPTAQDEIAHKRRRPEVQPEPVRRRGPRDTDE